MPFDAGPRSEPTGEPRQAFRADPIDWLDVVTRSIVLIPLLGLYTYWLWTVLQTVLHAFSGH